MRTTLIFCLSILSPALAAEARTWTDNTGEHRLEAELVGLAGDKVHLQTLAGRNFSIALDKLSPKDQKFVLKQNRNLQPGDLPVAATLTAAQSGTGSSSDGKSSPPVTGLPAPLGGNLSSQQNPAPLPLDFGSATGQAPATQEAQSPAAGGQQQTVPSKDKRIFSGCKSTFQLYSRDGTGAYWMDGKRYLAKLTFHKTEGNYVSFSSSGEGGVEAWAFRDVDSCGPSRVYAQMRGSSRWELFDYDSRELPN